MGSAVSCQTSEWEQGLCQIASQNRTRTALAQPSPMLSVFASDINRGQATTIAEPLCTSQSSLNSQLPLSTFNSRSSHIFSYSRDYKVPTAWQTTWLKESSASFSFTQPCQEKGDWLWATGIIKLFCHKILSSVLSSANSYTAVTLFPSLCVMKTLIKEIKKLDWFCIYFIPPHPLPSFVLSEAGERIWGKTNQ